MASLQVPYSSMKTKEQQQPAKPPLPHYFNPTKIRLPPEILPPPWPRRPHPRNNRDLVVITPPYQDILPLMPPTCLAIGATVS